ncbi:hypothetical protein BDZ97DRAFT_1922698 [Flammula alnicola]|nr:hypothetical protein BDZ97DRAFT_1922698 [Flammula alnicola]
MHCRAIQTLTSASILGMDLLVSQVVPGAFHTADENYDAPICHPNTRIAVLVEIMDWLNDTNDPHCAMWIRGAAGAGKSAIARTIAQICEERGRLSSSFFFSRTAGDKRRSDDKHLVATLAYQMMEYSSETQSFVSEAMANSGSIFDLTLDTQIDELIVIPLSRLSNTSSLGSPTLPKIIIIDGLDDCHNKDMQSVIVKEFVAAVARMQHNFPHKLLIASRPEQIILSAFSDRRVVPFLRVLSLDDRWKPDNDIRNFLVHSFADIRQTHPLRHLIPSDWPTSHDIEKLVEKSSGQFIYAATVSKYIKSRYNHPVQCLKIIIELIKDPEIRPYAELDGLYTYLFAQTEEPDAVLHILCILLMPSPTMMTIPFIQDLLSLDEGDVELALSGLSSIMEIKSSKINFLHASLPDFLLDETRAGRFYANSDRICVHLFRCCLRYISESKIGRGDIEAISICFLGLGHFAKSVRTAHSEIYDALAGFDLKFALKLAAKTADLLETSWQSMSLYVGEFLTWILQQHKKQSSFRTPYIPLEIISQLQEWVSDQLRKLPLDGPIASPLDNETFETVFADPEINFCYSLVFQPEDRYITFRRAELLGAFKMDGDERLYIALYYCHYFFSDRLEMVDFHSDAKERRMRHVAIHVSFFLQNAAPRIDVYLSLYKVLAFNSTQEFEEILRKASLRLRLVDPLVRYLELRLQHSFPSPSQENHDLALSLAEYLVKTHEAFPFLGKKDRYSRAKLVIAKWVVRWRQLQFSFGFSSFVISFIVILAAAMYKCL